MSRPLPPLISGTLYLSFAGVLTRILGFIYKIWLGNLLGAENLGLYQLTFPVFTIFLALCAAPFQTAVSRFTAGAVSEHEDSRIYLHAALTLSLILAGFGFFMILIFKKPIACFFLLNPRCENLLPWLAISIPLSSIHSCITGWYYGQKKTAAPALSNLFEQGIRLLYIYLLVYSSADLSVYHMMAALTLGEATATLWCFLNYKFHTRNLIRQRDFKKTKQALKKIFLLAWPLSANRLLLNLFQSIESIMIPSRLILYGCTESEALSIYGTLNGMAFSFILFPISLFGAFSILLLPDISEALSAGRIRYIKKASRLSIQFTLAAGCLFSIFFYCFGNIIGNTFYPNTLTGLYLRQLAWLCPFLYTNQIITSILHGMGFTALTFKIQLISLILRLFITVFLIPVFGLKCYFIGLLSAQVLIFFYSLNALYRKISALNSN